MPKMQNLTNYLDVDILELFKEKNINLTSQKINLANPEINVIELYQISKFAIHDHTSKTIMPNSIDTECHQRFNIARQIGHILYDHKNMKTEMIKNQQFNKNDIRYINTLMERQVNNFASKLLIPEKLVKEVNDTLTKQLTTNQRTNKLAKVFNVSYTLIYQRLKQLKLI